MSSYFSLLCYGLQLLLCLYLGVVESEKQPLPINNNHKPESEFFQLFRICFLTPYYTSWVFLFCLSTSADDFYLLRFLQYLLLFSCEICDYLVSKSSELHLVNSVLSILYEKIGLNGSSALQNQCGCWLWNKQSVICLN